MVENAEDLVQLLEVFLVAKGLEEQGQVIGVPFSQSLEVSLGCPRGYVIPYTESLPQVVTLLNEDSKLMHG